MVVVVVVVVMVVVVCVCVCMYVCMYIYMYVCMYAWGRRVIGISGSLIWPKTLMELTPVVNFCEVRKAQLAKSTLLTYSLVTLGSFQIF